MKVFIENEASVNKKNIFDEKTFRYKTTYQVSRPYPFPYGFIPSTKSGDGDCIDCFVLTSKPLKSGETIDCTVIGGVEMWDKNEVDHKVLAALSGEQVVLDDSVSLQLTDFLTHVFDHLEIGRTKVGNFLNAYDTVKLLKLQL